MRTSLLLAVSTALLWDLATAKNLVLKNNCAKPIQAGVLQNGQSSPTYYTISTGSSQTASLAANWGGRTWARIDCDQSSEQSNNTQCGVPGTPNPTSLAEFTFQGSGNQDFYDLSMVDGYNLPISIAPIGASQGSTQYQCGTPICKTLPTCPSDLTVLTSTGDLLSCQSDCSHYNEPQYCCTGAYGSASTCNGGPYAPMIKSACPDAYSFAYDDSTSTYTCDSGTATGYTITWCP
ncbi:thaumatin [Umbelopsis sp. PMI_123]|nr:thaumatin [Umbelopsis sp. PMI_123]